MKSTHFVLQGCYALTDQIGPGNRFIKFVPECSPWTIKKSVDCVSRKVQQEVRRCKNPTGLVPAALSARDEWTPVVLAGLLLLSLQRSARARLWELVSISFPFLPVFGRSFSHLDQGTCHMGLGLLTVSLTDQVPPGQRRQITSHLFKL